MNKAQEHFDIVIIGTGMGGGTLAYALRNSDARILLNRTWRLPAFGIRKLGR